jgi:hypothetical protein
MRVPGTGGSGKNSEEHWNPSGKNSRIQGISFGWSYENKSLGQDAFFPAIR